MPSTGTLRNSREFARVFSSGRRARRDGLSVFVVPTPGPSRIGIAARAGDAVTRNRIKRRIRAAARAGVPAQGVEVGIRADEASLNRNYQELERDLRAALRAAAEGRS